MTADPAQALVQLRRERQSGTLAQLCRHRGIDLLVAFGSASDSTRSVPPRDLDLAVLIADDRNLLDVIDALVVHLDLDDVDVMDLDRADEVARFQALGRGELLHEAEPGLFAEMQILALVQHADTQWLRDLELAALAR